MLALLADFWLFILLAIPATILTIYKARIKGAIGEKTVAWRLSRLPKSRYKIINNLVLSSAGKTSQIDHLVVSDYGLFVIETKNVKGWIFGRESSEFWTQVLFKRKEYIYNPIRQNGGHMQALRVALDGFQDIVYIPIVAFSSNASLKIEVTSAVVYTNELLETIRDYSDFRLSDERRDEIFTLLSSLDVSHSYNRRKHIREIKKRVNERERQVEQGICPRCGGHLLLRKGTYGKFLGCSGFPRCKFTSNGN
ncbi:MAG TPA: NERD domain-containing protein [Pedobacter sp.]|nr:NERD domain-containing protein [Pedobacter sp.]